MSDERYVVTTVISTHRMRYAIPVSALEKDGELPTIPLINPSTPTFATP